MEVIQMNTVVEKLSRIRERQARKRSALHKVIKTTPYYKFQKDRLQRLKEILGEKSLFDLYSVTDYDIMQSSDILTNAVFTIINSVKHNFRQATPSYLSISSQNELASLLEGWYSTYKHELAPVLAPFVSRKMESDERFYPDSKFIQYAYLDFITKIHFKVLPGTRLYQTCSWPYHALLDLMKFIKSKSNSSFSNRTLKYLAEHRFTQELLNDAIQVLPNAIFCGIGYKNPLQDVVLDSVTSHINFKNVDEYPRPKLAFTKNIKVPWAINLNFQLRIPDKAKVKFIDHHVLWGKVTSVNHNLRNGSMKVVDPIFACKACTPGLFTDNSFLLKPVPDNWKDLFLVVVKDKFIGFRVLFFPIKELAFVRNNLRHDTVKIVIPRSPLSRVFNGKFTFFREGEYVGHVNAVELGKFIL